jgi:thimet oligopeptidase
LSTDDADLRPVLLYAKAEALRRQLQMERWNVAAPANVAVLGRMLTLRYQIASLLGFSSWADYHAQTRMAGSATAISAFLDKANDASRAQATREYSELLTQKQRDTPDATIVNSWDRPYYEEVVRRSSYDFDSQAVRPYFPYERVRAGIMEVAGRLFDMTFRRVPNLPTWDPSVESWEVLRGQTVLARLYLDVHGRAHKSSTEAWSGSVHRGVAGRQLPEIVLAASVPGGVSGDPGLLTHEQVRTLFHEFGHVIHAIVAGRGPWYRLNGIDVEPDAAEVPSTMLEEWMWDPNTLSMFARHYLTGEPIPPDKVERMRRAAEFGRGLNANGQVYLSLIALALHDRAPKDLDPTAVVKSVHVKYSLFPWTDGAFREAQFTHLANPGYTSSYYTYVWSRVIAKDLFTRFDPLDLLRPRIARDYRDKVLVPGGSKPASELFGDFLGRPFNFSAYQNWLNN